MLWLGGLRSGRGEGLNRTTMTPVRGENKNPFNFSEGYQQIVLVDIPNGGHIKEIIIRHPLSYDFATSQFKEITPEEAIKLLKKP